MSKRASLAELMGKTGSSQGISMSNLHQILGDAMPELPRDQVGRHRLVTALHQRFGDGFRNLPGVKDLIAQFDGQIEHEQRVRKLSAIKYTPTPPKGRR